MMSPRTVHWILKTVINCICSADILMWNSGSLGSKRYGIKEETMHVVYSVNQKLKDRNLIDASPYTSMYNMYISWWVYFMTGLQQPLTAWLAKTKTDIAKKSSYCYLSCCWPKTYLILYPSLENLTAPITPLRNKLLCQLFRALR